MAFQTLDQSDEETWPDQKFELFWNFWGTFFGIFWNFFGNFWKFFGNFLGLFWNFFGTFLEILWNKYNDKDNHRDLWLLRHWLQFWQLRTWIHDNLWDLTINCDTGQHSQFLRCFCLQANGSVWLLVLVHVKSRSWSSSKVGWNWTVFASHYLTITRIPFMLISNEEIFLSTLVNWKDICNLCRTNPALHVPVKFGSPPSPPPLVVFNSDATWMVACGDDITIRNEYFPIRIWPEVGLGLACRCDIGWRWKRFIEILR